MRQHRHRYKQLIETFAGLHENTDIIGKSQPHIETLQGCKALARSRLERPPAKRLGKRHINQREQAVHELQSKAKQFTDERTTRSTNLAVEAISDAAVARNNVTKILHTHIETHETCSDTREP